MMNEQVLLDVTNLSSRKLWELLSTDDCLSLSYQQQFLATQELLLRRHYVEQLKTLPQLSILKRQSRHCLLDTQAGIH